MKTPSANSKVGINRAYLRSGDNSGVVGADLVRGSKARIVCGPCSLW